MGEWTRPSARLSSRASLCSPERWPQICAFFPNHCRAYSCVPYARGRSHHIACSGNRIMRGQGRMISARCSELAGCWQQELMTSCPHRPSGASEVRGFLQTKQLQEIAAKELKINKWSNACIGLAGNRLFWGSKPKGKKHNPCYMKIRFATSDSFIPQTLLPASTILQLNSFREAPFLRGNTLHWYPSKLGNHQ